MGETLITHISTGHNHSDLLTKATSGAKRRHLVGGILYDIYDDLEGTEEICPCVLRRLMTGHRE